MNDLAPPAPESSVNSGLSAERIAELADLFRVGRDVRLAGLVETRGTVTEHLDRGVLITRYDGLPTYFAWAALHTANTIVSEVRR